MTNPTRCPDLLAIATELVLTPVFNTEAFDRPSRNGRPRNVKSEENPEERALEIACES
jgi:hypothetical protein